MMVRLLIFQTLAPILMANENSVPTVMTNEIRYVSSPTRWLSSSSTVSRRLNATE